MDADYFTTTEQHNRIVKMNELLAQVQSLQAKLDEAARREKELRRVMIDVAEDLGRPETADDVPAPFVQHCATRLADAVLGSER